MSQIIKAVFVALLLITSNAHAMTCDALFAETKASQINPFHELIASPEKPIRFDLITPEIIDSEFAVSLETARQKFLAITSQSRQPNFKNTIAALHETSESLDIVAGLLSHYSSVDASPALRALSQKWMSQAQDLQNEMNFNSALFERVRSIYERRDRLRLSREQMTMVESLYRGFVANGASLGAAQKARVAAIDSRLTKLTQDFSSNQVSASAKAKLTVKDAALLRGIPADVVEAAKELATLDGQTGAWVFLLKGRTPRMIQMFAHDRGLREAAWRLTTQLNVSGEFDNRAVLFEIVKLREERAQVLGFRSHAEFATQDRMAGTPEVVNRFIDELSREYKPGALKDAEELQAFATSRGRGPLAYWDLAYYTNELRKARYDLDTELLRPYLNLEAVHLGSLQVAERLFGIQFVADSSASRWAADVRVYRVIDKKKNDAFVGYFYFDPFTRAGKRPGAWMNTLLTGGEWGGRKVRPHVINVMNFAPPTKATPSLLSLGDATTIFHELGHGLHGLLSKTRYRATASPNIAWDVVELPSQLFEAWFMDPATLQSFAKHYKTGETLPLHLIEKVRAAENFRVASGNLAAMEYAALDMAWYSGDTSRVNTVDDIQSFEQEVTRPFSVYPPSGALKSPTFGHIFSGGYSAGYYSYKWADVLVADAWELFESRGIYNQKVAARYRNQFLSKGGAENAALLYERFRGRSADPKAVLRREGLLPKTSTAQSAEAASPTSGGSSVDSTSR